MHLLIGFVIFVALVAFAFGSEAARKIVRTVMVFGAIIVLAGLTYFAVDVWRELRVDSNGADAAAAAKPHAANVDSSHPPMQNVEARSEFVRRYYSECILSSGYENASATCEQEAE